MMDGTRNIQQLLNISRQQAPWINVYAWYISKYNYFGGSAVKSYTDN